MLQITEQARDELVIYLKLCSTPVGTTLQGGINLITYLLQLKPIEKENAKMATKSTKNKKKQKKSPEVLEENG